MLVIALHLGWVNWLVGDAAETLRRGWIYVVILGVALIGGGMVVMFVEGLVYRRHRDGIARACYRSGIDHATLVMLVGREEALKDLAEQLRKDSAGGLFQDW